MFAEYRYQEAVQRSETAPYRATSVEREAYQEGTWPVCTNSLDVMGWTYGSFLTSVSAAIVVRKMSFSEEIEKLC